MKNLQMNIFLNSKNANAGIDQIILSLTEKLQDKTLSPYTKKIIKADIGRCLSVMKQIRDLEVMESFYNISPSPTHILNS